MHAIETTPGAELSERDLQRAVTALQLAGCVAVTGSFEPQFIAELRAAVRADLEAGRAVESQPGTGQYTTLHSFEPPFSDAAITANPVVLQLGSALMGPGWTCAIYNTNIATPGSSPQRVHMDHPRVAGDGAEPRNDFHLVWHVTLCEFTDPNGSTEMWPGSHRCLFKREDPLEDVAEVLPSVRGNGPPGTLVFREGALWHRATPNVTDDGREMLSFFGSPSTSAARTVTVGRPLRIRRGIFDALPPAARSVWAINEIVD